MSGYLYRFEARGIQSYILGHRKLKRLLGASAIVRELVRDVLPRVLGQIGMKADVDSDDLENTLLISAAGLAVVAFESKAKLQQFLRVWPYIVATYAPGLRTAQAWVDGDKNDDAAHKKLEARLKQVRKVPPVDLPAGNPVMDRSAYRKLPALPKPVLDEDSGTEETIDASAACAIRMAEKLRPNKPGEPLNKQSLEYFVYKTDGVEPPDATFPRDLNEMTEGRYIAVIHADANGIGAWFRGKMKFDERRKRSRALGRISRAALRAGLKKAQPNAADNDDPKFVLGVPILCGGDDLVMILRADRANDFLIAYAAEFKAGMSRYGYAGFSLSAGVAFVRPNHAFHLAHRLADQLGKRAKNASERGFSSMWAHRFTDLLAADPPRYASPLALESHPTVLQSDVAQEVADLIVARDVSRGPLRRMLTAMEDGDVEGAKRLWRRFLDVHSRRASTKDYTALIDALTAVDPRLPETPVPSDDISRSPWPNINTLAVAQEAL